MNEKRKYKIIKTSIISAGIIAFVVFTFLNAQIPIPDESSLIIIQTHLIIMLVIYAIGVTVLLEGRGNERGELT